MSWILIYLVVNLIICLLVLYIRQKLSDFDRLYELDEAIFLCSINSLFSCIIIIELYDLICVIPLYRNRKYNKGDLVYYNYNNIIKKGIIKNIRFDFEDNMIVYVINYENITEERITTINLDAYLDMCINYYEYIELKEKIENRFNNIKYILE